MPDGYFVLRPRTYGHIMFSRGFMEHGDPRAAVAESIRAGFRIYPLAAASDPPAMDFVQMSGAPLAAVFASDASFFEQVAAVVHDEPLDAVDPETRGLLASIGIRKDAPFAPDARMQAILAEAAAVGNATARALAFSTREPRGLRVPGQRVEGALDRQRLPVLARRGPRPRRAGHLLLSRLRDQPGGDLKMVGVGSQYVLSERDAAGRYLDGGKAYRLHLPPGIPRRTSGR